MLDREERSRSPAYAYQAESQDVVITADESNVWDNITEESDVWFDDEPEHYIAPFPNVEEYPEGGYPEREDWEI